MKRSRLTFWCAAAALFLSAPAQAQDYPNKPVTFITPAAAGNSPECFRGAPEGTGIQQIVMPRLFHAPHRSAPMFGKTI